MEYRHKQKHQERKKTERIIIGLSDTFRRNNLLKNAEYGLGKTQQMDKHLLYIVGSEDYGYVEYLILHASLSLTSNENR